MYTKFLALICLVMIIAACRKSHYKPDDPEAPLPPTSDVVGVKLKDISVDKIPSPQYHFVYNDSGYITHVGFESGAATYDITYSGKRIAKVETNKDIPFDINKDILEYEYKNGDPVLMKVTDKTGMLYRKCSLSFSAAHQLQKLTWELNPGTGFVTEQTLEFSYYADSNLKEIAYHDFAVGPITEKLYKEKFEDYDNKVNAGGFSWLHTLLHHPVFLPSVRLQINNPRKDIRTGPPNTFTYETTYAYTYDASGRPLTRVGPVKFVDPQGNPGQFTSSTTYSYY